MAVGTRNSSRYASIDLLRGTALVAMLLVSSRSPLPQLRHGRWTQVTLADLVYPCFLLLIGVSMAISSSRSRSTAGASNADYYRRFLRRIFWLFAIGVALTAAGSGRLALGTLQSIAIASLLALPVVFARWQFRVAYLLLCIGVQLLLYAFFADPGMMWSPEGNGAAQLDLALLGKYRGVEGILGSLFSGLFVVLGLVAGAVLSKPREEQLRICFYVAAPLALIGLALEYSAHLPVISRLISPTFFLLAGALLVATTGLATWLFDRGTLPLPLRPIARVGENPLAIFCGVKLFQDFILRIEFGGTQLAEYIREVIRASVSDSLGLASIPLIKVVVAFMIAEYLAKKQLRLRL